jgi:hypothetical protein
MVLLKTALLVPMFALALQSEKRAELANERIDFFRRMASSSSHINNGITLATQLEWYKIRDTFFGHNYVSQKYSFWLSSWPLLASIQMLAGSLWRVLERM